jgi:DSF synthase
MGNVASLSDQLKLRGQVVQQTGQRPWLERFSKMAELDVAFDENDTILWQRPSNLTRPNISVALASDFCAGFSAIRQGYAEDTAAGRSPIRYSVLASSMPGVFSLGGDLPFFVEAIGNRDKVSLSLYARRCIDVVYGFATNMDLPIHTIALVQGDAMGGGFEVALANDAIIAERSAKFALPEILFNLFPGMGAYTLLARKLDVVRAERMILSGDTYTAEQLHEMGLVDVVAEDGQGEAALYDYIERHERQYGARQSIMQARKIAKPISYEELKGIVEIWVDAALCLKPADIRKMQLIVKAQSRRMSTIGHGEMAEHLSTGRLTA